MPCALHRFVICSFMLPEGPPGRYDVRICETCNERRELEVEVSREESLRSVRIVPVPPEANVEAFVRDFRL